MLDLAAQMFPIFLTDGALYQVTSIQATRIIKYGRVIDDLAAE